jgi:hypothetical protein
MGLIANMAGQLLVTPAGIGRCSDLPEFAISHQAQRDPVLKRTEH